MPKPGKHWLTDTGANKSSDSYRDGSDLAGRGHDIKGNSKEPRGHEPGGITQTTRSVDSHDYSERVYPGGGGHTLNYGVNPDDVAEAKRCHGAFDSALKQNVDGLGFKKNPKHDGSMGNQNEWALGGEISHNPSTSEKQRRFFGAELERSKHGEQTQTGLGKKKLREFARKPRGRY